MDLSKFFEASKQEAVRQGEAQIQWNRDNPPDREVRLHSMEVIGMWYCEDGIIIIRRPAMKLYNFHRALRLDKELVEAIREESKVVSG